MHGFMGVSSASQLETATMCALMSPAFLAPRPAVLLIVALLRLQAVCTVLATQAPPAPAVSIAQCIASRGLAAHTVRLPLLPH